MVRQVVLSLASFIRLDAVFYEFKRKRNLATILSLHRISDDPDHFWPPMKTTTFKKLLQYCAQNYEVKHLSDLGKRNQHKPELALTFDDGYSDFIENAVPELVRLGMPSNHNVVIDCVERNAHIWTQDLNALFSYARESEFEGALPLAEETVHFRGNRTPWMELNANVYQTLLHQTKEERIQLLDSWKELLGASLPSPAMMDWDQVKKCQERDVEIGSHTVSHHTLTAMKDASSLFYEINFSRQRLEQMLAAKCLTLALPNGQCNGAVLDVIRDAGYERVLLANDKYFAVPFDNSNSFDVIPRINMIEEPISDMKLRIEGFHQFMKHGRLRN